MKKTIYIIISLLVFNFSTLAQDGVKQVREKFKPKSSEVKLKIDYIDFIKVGVSESDSIEVLVKVHLADAKGKLVNEKYHLKVRHSKDRSEIVSEIKNMTAHYVFQRSGVDYDPESEMYKADKALIVGTEMDIKIPEGIDFEIETDMGEITVDHNGGGLLISTLGNVSIDINEDLKADLALSSLYGNVFIDEDLDFDLDIKSEEGFVRVSGGKNSILSLNSGGENISITTFADIKVARKK